MTNDLPSRSSIQARIALCEKDIRDLRARLEESFDPDWAAYMYRDDIQAELNERIGDLQNLRGMFVDVSGL